MFIVGNVCTVCRATSCHWGPMYLVDSKSSEFVVKVSGGIIFASCNIKIIGSSHGTTLRFYFLLAVSGSIGDKFGFTNLRNYSSLSEFYDYSCFLLDNIVSMQNQL